MHRVHSRSYVRSSVAPHLPPLRVSESTEVWADPWSPLIGLPSPEVRLSVVMADPCSGEIRCARLSARELGQTGLRGHLAGVDR